MCIFREEIGGKGRVVALSCTVDIVCLYHYIIYIYIYVCVCVCQNLFPRYMVSRSCTCILIHKAGGQPREHSWLSNEEGYATADMESDQLHVPAFIFRNKIL